MSRLFTYGCSFTKYYYPTWADILIKDAHLGYNCGHIGSGNQLIANRIWETNSRTKFNNNDIIIIMWSNFFREDRYHDKDGWHTPGNIFNHLTGKRFTLNNYTYESDVEWANNLNHYVYRDCNIISSTLEALQNTGATVLSTCINDPYKDEKLLAHGKVKNILDQYSKWVMPQCKTITEHCHYPNIENDKTRIQYKQGDTWMIEDHPMPKEHLSYVDEVITEYVDLKVSQETIQWIIDIQSQYQSMELVQYDTIFDQSTNKIGWVV